MRSPRDYWFYGRDDGSWEFVGRPLLSFKREGFDWQLAPAMSAKNSGMNFSVEGATETHENFRSALSAIVAKHPEIRGWAMSFDGPMVAVDAVLALPKFSWGSWTFYHGTAEAAVPSLRRVGLCPRDVTGAAPAYGGKNKEGRSDAVYLTTQMGMAHFAARDAGRNTQSRPVILSVHGVVKSLVVPDEDSGEKSARASLDRMGSFGVRGCIAPHSLSVVSMLVQGEWHDVSR